MALKAGRRIGSKVQLTTIGKTVYPQWAGKVGRITRKEILTVGHGLARGQRARYAVSYWVRWEGEKRDYFLGSPWLKKAAGGKG